MTVSARGEPRQGGEVVFGLEAETDGWDPNRNRWAPSGTQVGLTIYDPLAAFDEDGVARPYLAESIEPNATYDVWTIKLREGVKFHNGETLRAEHVAEVLNIYANQGITALALGAIGEARAVDDLTVEVTTDVPWASFPAVLTGQGGVIPYPPTLGANGGEAGTKPIGTGPFVFKEWEPNRRLVVERNRDYWMKDSEGRQLPYLNRIEFRPIPEVTVRDNALIAGDITMMYTSSNNSIVNLRRRADSGELQLVEDRGEPEESLILLNTNKPPTDDLRIRRALAMATNQEELIRLNGGIARPANGPWPPDSPWYADPDYPDFDPDEARRLVDEYKRDKGVDRVTIELSTTPATENIATVNAIQQMWQRAGIEVKVRSLSQDQFIGTAVSGDFQANLWRQFGAVDPDGEYHWWHISSATEGVAINFARIEDPGIAKALDRGRQSADPEVRREAYKVVQDRMAELVPFVWISHTMSAVAAQPFVRGLTNGPLPSGDAAWPMGGPGGFPGVIFLTQVWIEQ